MKTVIVKVPDKKEKTFATYLKKNRYRSKVISREYLEDVQMVKWIDEGMKTEDVPVEKVFAFLAKNGTGR